MQKNRESLEEFFALYKKVKDDVEKEDEEEREGDDEDDEKMNEEEFINKYLQPEEVEIPDRNMVKKNVKKILKEILQEVDKQRMKITDILRAVDDGDDASDITSKLVALMLIHSATGEKNEQSGEWMYSKINELKTSTMNSEYSLVPGMMKEIMYKNLSFLTPQDLKELACEVSQKGEHSYDVDPMEKINVDLRKKAENLQKEGIVLKDAKASKLGFPELGLCIKSKKIGETRVWPCPVEGCIEAFKTSRTCDSHLNWHLDYEYGPCEKCGYTSTHLDSFQKHTCFSNLQEKRGGSRKRTARAEAAGSAGKVSKISKKD